MSLIENALRASGGLDLWRLTRRFKVHLSISGTLHTARFGAAPLKELVAEGSTHVQELEITGLPRADVRGLYRRDRVALEDSNAQRIAERHALPEEFRRDLRLAQWDELLIAHYYGYLLWNYIATPFILADPDFKTKELRRKNGEGQRLRRLEAEFPTRVITHAHTQIFHFDRPGLLRRLDYPAAHQNDTRVAQMFSGHQRFAGILVPTLCSLLSVGDDGVPVAKPSLLDLEIFDVNFE